MAIAEPLTLPLESGQFLSNAEFLRRWEAMPDLRSAELTGGIVYLASPVSLPHRNGVKSVFHWVSIYAELTPGCDAGTGATWILAPGEIPQPDAELIIKPEYGGQSGIDGNYCAGAPELVAEVAVTTAARDLGEKRDAYRAAGVREYIVVQPLPRTITWTHFPTGTAIEAGSGGLLRSLEFPGLWLDPEAMFSIDRPRISEVLRQGCATPDHAAFVRRLESRRR